METLASRIAREGPLNTTDAVGWIVRLARNIEKLHAREAVYGRISPHCMLIERDAHTSVGCLTDPEQAPELLSYYSPERAAGVPGGPSDDTWALAATLFEAIVGVPAFQGASDNETRAQLVSARPTLRGPMGALEDKLQAIFDRAFSRQWLQRTRDIPTLRQDLEALYPGVGFAALPPLEELRKPAPAAAPPPAADDDMPIISVKESVSNEDDDTTTLGSRRGSQLAKADDARAVLSRPKGLEPAPVSRPPGSRSKGLEPAPVSRPPGSRSKGLEPAPVSRPPGSRSKGLELAPVSRPPGSRSKGLEPAPISAHPSSRSKGLEPAPISAHPSSRSKGLEPAPISAHPSSRSKGQEPAPISSPPSSRSRGFESAPVSGPPSSRSKGQEPAPGSTPSQRQPERTALNWDFKGLRGRLLSSTAELAAPEASAPASSASGLAREDPRPATQLVSPLDDDSDPTIQAPSLLDEDAEPTIQGPSRLDDDNRAALKAAMQPEAPAPLAPALPSVLTDDDDRESPTTVMDPREAAAIASEHAHAASPLAPHLAPAAIGHAEPAPVAATRAPAAPPERAILHAEAPQPRSRSRMALLLGSIAVISAVGTAWVLRSEIPPWNKPVTATPEGTATATAIEPPRATTTAAPTLAASEVVAAPPSSAATEAPEPSTSAATSAAAMTSAVPSASAATSAVAMTSAVPSASAATSAVATTSAVPATSAAMKAPTSTQLNACVIPLFAADTFTPEKPPDFSFLCQETDPRRGGAALKSQVVRASGGRVSEGMREWAVLSWYEMAAFALMRARCCPSPPPLTLPNMNGPCIPLDQRLNELTAATLGMKANDVDLKVRQAADQYTRAIHCAVKNGTTGPFPWKGGLQGGEDLAFLKTLARVAASKH
jgi:hypothetical protein